MTLRRLAGDTLIYGTGYILGKILNYLLITIYLTWKFNGEVAQYGLYTDFYFYVALLLVLLTFRMETTYFRFANDKTQRETAFGQASLIVLTTALLWACIVVIFRTPLANALEYPGYEKHVVTLGFILALDVMVSVPFAALRLEGRPLRYSMLRLLAILVNIVAVLFFLELVPVFAEKGAVWASWYSRADRLYYVFLANLIGSLTVFLIFLPSYFRARLIWNGTLAKKMLRYAWPLVVVGMAGVINQSSYITFQKYILPNSLIENLSEGGVYAAATRVAILMSLFTTAFNYAAEPFFFRLADTHDAHQTYAEIAKAFTVAACVLMAGILLYLDVVQLVLGESFRGALYVVPILLLGFLFLGLYYNFSVWYKITDRTVFGAMISAVGAVLTIVLNIVLIRKLQVMGSAWAALACYAFMTAVCYWIGRKYYPIPYDLRRITIHIVSVLVLYWVSTQLSTLFGENLGQELLVNTVLFVGYLWLLYRFERPMIRSVVRRSP